MATKAIVDIEVNDEAFKKFRDAVKEFQGKVKFPSGAGNIPSGPLGGAIGGAGINIFNINSNLERAVKTQTSFARGISGANDSMKKLAENSKSVASSLYHATTSLIRWAGISSIISGLLGGGALFGLDRLSASATGLLSSSRGYGVSPAQQRSLGVNFGQYFDTNGLLGAIGAAQMDPSKWGAFAALGIRGAQTRNPADLAIELAIRGKSLIGQYGYVGANARGLGQFFGPEEERRLANTPMAELLERRRQFRENQGRLSMPPEVLRQWAELTRKLNLAGDAIEATFIRGLSRLTSPLAHLSDSVQKVASAFIDRLVKDGVIDKVATALDKFAQYIGKQQFEDDVKGFADGIGYMATAIKKFVENWKAWMPPSMGGEWGTPEREIVLDPFGLRNPRVAPEFRGDPGLRSPYENTDIPTGMIDAIWAAESDRGQNVTTSPAGARGDFQFMPDTWNEFGNGGNIMDPDDARAAARRYVRYLLGKYHGNTAEALAAYNWGPAKLDADIAAHPDDALHKDNWRNYVPPETRDYLRKTETVMAADRAVTIRIQNHAGANVITNSSQLVSP